MALLVWLAVSLVATDPEHVVYFTGYIDEASVDRFEAQLTGGGIDAVVLRSPGGRDLQAIRAGNLILDHGLDVRVEEYCISACASFMLPAGATRAIADGAIVSWHLTAASACLSLDCQEAGDPDRRRLVEYLEPSLALYRRAGVNPRIFTDQITAHNALCYLSRRHGGRTEYRIRVEYEHWVPSSRYLDAIGLDLQGDWPAFDEVGARFQRHFAVIPKHYKGGEVEYYDTVEPAAVESCES